jgi:hypothetical protein
MNIWNHLGPSAADSHAIWKKRASERSFVGRSGQYIFTRTAGELATQSGNKTHGGTIHRLFLMDIAEIRLLFQELEKVLLTYRGANLLPGVTSAIRVLSDETHQPDDRISEVKSVFKTMVGGYGSLGDFVVWDPEQSTRDTLNDKPVVPVAESFTLKGALSECRGNAPQIAAVASASGTESAARSKLSMDGKVLLRAPLACPESRRGRQPSIRQH